MLQRFYHHVVKKKCEVNVLNIAKNVVRTQRDDRVRLDDNCSMDVGR